MTELRLDQGTEDSIAAKHDSAASSITGLVDSVPTSVDGGYGTAAILEILSVVVATADDIAVLNEVAAGQVRAVGQDFGTTDDAVHDNFRKLDVTVDS
jgi:hypothetical protein